MATGEKPWKGYDMVLNIFSKLSQNQVPPLQGVQDVETLRFVKICLESDPEIRPGAEDLLLDPYLMVDPYSYQYATFVKDSMLKREQKLVTESSEGETDTDEHESD